MFRLINESCRDVVTDINQKSWKKTFTHTQIEHTFIVAQKFW